MRLWALFALFISQVAVEGAWVQRALQRVGAGVVASSLTLGVPVIVLAEAPVEVEIPTSVRGKGGIDAFAAAGKALSDPRMKMKSLSGNDYELVQKGEKALSTAPRASKRRALQDCRDGGIRKFVGTGKKGIFGEETIDEKTCINRVMDGDFKFILDASEKASKAKR